MKDIVHSLNPLQVLLLFATNSLWQKSSTWRFTVVRTEIKSNTLTHKFLFSSKFSKLRIVGSTGFGGEYVRNLTPRFLQHFFVILEV